MDRKELWRIVLVVLAIILAILLAYFLWTSIGKRKGAEQGGAAGQPPVEDEETAFLTYENLVYGIGIKYPRDWTKNEQPSEGIIVMFISPAESPSDEFPENLHVMVEDLSAQPMTLSEYTEFNLNQLDQFFPDFTFLELDEVALAGYPAHKLVFTATKDNYRMKSLQIWAIKNNKAYVITCAAELEKYSIFLGTFEDMIGSFEIL